MPKNTKGEASIRKSRYLSYLLRHGADKEGIKRDEAGWMLVADIISFAKQQGRKLTRADIMEIVATDDKERYALCGHKKKIRANQGHSMSVDLGLEPVLPPTYLYHGTQPKFLKSISEDGLKPMSRHHVHLSADIPTARAVASRRGDGGTILLVRAREMHDKGFKFFESENGVWLTDIVPPHHIDFSGQV